MHNIVCLVVFSPPCTFFNSLSHFPLCSVKQMTEDNSAALYVHAVILYSVSIGSFTPAVVDCKACKWHSSACSM